METTQLIDRLKARLDELRARDQRLDQEQRQIAEQRGALANEISNIEVTISITSQYTKPDQVIKEQAEAFPPTLTGSIPEAAAQLMEQRGGEMELGEIHEALLQAGSLRPTQHSRTTLWKSLDRRRDLFAKAGKGRWRLRGRVGQAGSESSGVITVVA